MQVILNFRRSFRKSFFGGATWTRKILWRSCSTRSRKIPSPLKKFSSTSMIAFHKKNSTRSTKNSVKLNGSPMNFSRPRRGLKATLPPRRSSLETWTAKFPNSAKNSGGAKKLCNDCARKIRGCRMTFPRRGKRFKSYRGGLPTSRATIPSWRRRINLICNCPTRCSSRLRASSAKKIRP